MSKYTAGTFLARPTTASHGESPKKGTPVVDAHFELLEGPDKGKEISTWLFLTDKTEARTCEALMSCGWTGKDWQNLPGYGSKEVYLVLEDEQNGEYTNTKVKWINAKDRVAGVKPSNEASVKGFSERMERLAKSVKDAAPKSDGETLKGEDGKELF